MPFYERTLVAKTLIEELTKAYWVTEEISKKYSIFHIPYGYETHIPKIAQDVLKNVHTKTSRFIRFTPDFIVFQKNNDKVFLLEYKVTRTPRYSLKDKQWNSGQIEAVAWNNYIALLSIGVDLAIVIYCPYHSRPLLCDVVNPAWITKNQTIPKKSSGSGTPYVNIDLTKLQTFETFMETYFKVPVSVSKHLLSVNFFEQLRNNPLLATKHDKRSPYNNSNYTTGFNWEKRYKYI
jgi:hypothetical protein